MTRVERRAQKARIEAAEQRLANAIVALVWPEAERAISLATATRNSTARRDHQRRSRAAA